MVLKCELFCIFFFRVRVVCDDFVFYVMALLLTLAILFLRFMRDIFVITMRFDYLMRRLIIM